MILIPEPRPRGARPEHPQRSPPTAAAAFSGLSTVLILIPDRIDIGTGIVLIWYRDRIDVNTGTVLILIPEARPRGARRAHPRRSRPTAALTFSELSIVLTLIPDRTDIDDNFLRIVNRIDIDTGPY